MRRSSNNNNNFSWKDKVMKDKGVPSSSTTSSSVKSPNKYNNSPPKRKTSEVNVSNVWKEDIML